VLDSSSETVGPIAGAELRKKAIYLVCLGLLFQLIYIGIRFKGAVWGTAATIAVLHDVLVTLGLLAFSNIDQSQRHCGIAHAGGLQRERHDRYF